MKYWTQWIVLTGWLITSLPLAFAADNQAVIDAIQKSYDATNSFQAQFVQKSFLKVMGSAQEAHGTVLIKKPGKMKWEYTAPDPQILISNTEALWLYLPEEEQATKMQVESIYSSNAPALFLAGRGKLTDAFKVNKVERKDKVTHVSLVPREADQNVDRLVLIADNNNYQIIGSRVYDKLGNKTEIIFSDIRVNPDIAEREFQFKIPEGVELIDLTTKH